MFSKASEYAIRATVFIAEQSLQNKKVGQKVIAKAIDSPEAFTAKTLQKLTRNKLVSAERGPNGGFYLSEDQMKKGCLKNIVDAIDGDALFKDCGMGLHKCNDKKPCPLHVQFKAIRESLTIMMESTTIYQMANQMRTGDAFLKQ